MTYFSTWALPMPVIRSPGGTIDLKSIIAAQFGLDTATWNDYWIAYYPTSQLTTWNFNYWDPAHPSVSTWLVNGADIGGGFGNQTYVAGANIQNAVLRAGNAFGPFAYVTVPQSSDGTAYTQYSIITVDPRLMSPVAGHGAPKAQDIVDTAYRFDAFYGFVPNSNDCGWIAMDVAAATGATLTDKSQSIVPTENEEAGFWRIVYRGSDPNPVSHWQTLVRPGDIVRMGWAAGSFHTTTVLAVNADFSMVVYDNAKSGGIGVHTVNYDPYTVASTVTIFRLTTDGLYLVNGSTNNDLLTGTFFNDHVLGGVGNDSVKSGAGNDVLEGGSGTNSLAGGGGFDRANYSIASGAATITRNANGSVSISGSGFSDTLTGVEVAHFTDRDVALREVARGDFNGEGTSDLVLQSGGTVVDWLMQNGTYQSGNVLTTGATGFTVVGKGDFNGDGTADLALQNGGTVVNWIMGNGAYQTGNVITTGATGFAVKAAGDLNGDGTTDLVLQNGGTVVDWIMQNGTFQSGNIITSGATGYTVVGSGDLNGDGTADIILQNGGTVVAWLMKNGVFQSGNVITTGASGFTVKGVGDVNGDGTADIVLQNGGTVVDWIMQNGTFQSGNVITSGAAGFNVVGVGDYNGDGTADIALQNGGTVVDWLMKNGVFQSGNVITAGATGFTVV